MRKVIKPWMLAVAGFTVMGAGCSKDSSSESEYVEPGASEGNEAPPAEAPTQPLEPIPPPAAPTEEPLTPPPPANAEPTTQAPTLKDAQIVKITDSVNAAEIEQAKLAKTKSKNAKVKKFATLMISEHTKAKQKGLRLAKSSDMSPEDSDLGGQLQTKAERTLEGLKEVDATGFDGAYMNAQVQQHREVLNLIDSELLPAAANAELKAELQAAREMVKHHLDEGEQIQQSLTE